MRNQRILGGECQKTNKQNINLILGGQKNSSSVHKEGEGTPVMTHNHLFMLKSEQDDSVMEEREKRGHEGKGVVSTVGPIA